jgi:hypothetical protein
VQLYAWGYNRAEVQELMEILPIGFDEEPQAPENVIFRNVTLNLYPDRRRVKVGIQITSFLTPPNIEIVVEGESETRVASASIIGPSGPNFEITLHLRGELLASEYKFVLTLGHEDNEHVDQKIVMLQMPESDNHLKGS